MEAKIPAIVALDQSTSATKAALVSIEGKIITSASKVHASSYPKKGWVEQDPTEIATNSITLLKEVVSSPVSKDYSIKGLGITNQRETIVVWNRKTGLPLSNAIGWQCLRGQEIVEEWRQQPWARFVQLKTGLPLDPHFSAPKISWILRNVRGAREEAEAGNFL